MIKSLCPISHAILQTLNYSANYEFPLNKEEIHKRLQLLQASPQQIDKALSSLVSTGQVISSNKLYTITGKKNFFQLRKTREDITIHKLSLNERVIRTISLLPWVQAIYLTGSLAVNNAKPDDDLDLMLITTPKRLWLVRVITTIITEFFGVRRRPNTINIQDENNRVCLNLYLTTSTLQLPLHKRSLYTAYEIIQAKPLYDPYNTQQLFLSSNAWITSFLPNYPIPPYTPIHNSINNPFLDSLNSLFYLLQRKYMAKRLTNEYIRLESAFFHPKTHDHAKKNFYTLNSIKTVAQKYKSKKKTIVLVTGFFDLLHSEHINFLQKAKAQGDILIAAIESDQRARTLKGEGRPIETQVIRAEKIFSTGLVNKIVLLNESFSNQQSYTKLLKNTYVDIYAISSHTKHQDNKKKLVEELGGRLVIVHDWNKNISTTQIINSQQQDI